MSAKPAFPRTNNEAAGVIQTCSTVIRKQALATVILLSARDGADLGRLWRVTRRVAVRKRHPSAFVRFVQSLS